MAKQVLQSYQLRSAHHAQLRSLIVLCYRWGINSNQRLDLLNITHPHKHSSIPKKPLSEKSGGKNPTHTRRLKRSRFNRVKVFSDHTITKKDSWLKHVSTSVEKHFTPFTPSFTRLKYQHITLLTQQMSFYFFLLPKSDTNCSFEWVQKKQQKQERVFSLSPEAFNYHTRIKREPALQLRNVKEWRQ